MGRVRRKYIKGPTNNIQRNSCQEKGDQNTHPSKELSFGGEPSDEKCNNRSKRMHQLNSPLVTKSSDKTNRSPVTSSALKQKVHHLKNAVVLLEDIGINSSLVAKRTVLGDKTNRSTMLLSNHKQKEVCGSPDMKQQRKILCSSSGRMNKERYTNSVQGICENLTKSPVFPDKCIYSKVQRETLRNKNMPIEAKLAQYEFEVDENEPVVKKKNVKRKKKVKPKEEYCPPAKVLKKIFQSVEEVAEKMKNKPKDVNDLKCNRELSERDVCNEQILGCEARGDALPPLVTESVRKRICSFAANDVAMPNSPRSVKRSRRGVGGLADLELGAREDSVICKESFLEKSQCNVNLNESVDSGALREMPSSANMHNHESHIFKSPLRLQSATSLNKTISTPIRNDQDERFPFSEVTSTSTPMFKSTPTFRNSQNVTALSDNSFIDCSVNKKASIIPRESGGVNNLCNKVLTENWSVENCFGFDDSDDTAEPTTFVTDTLKQRPRNTTTFSSTSSNKKSRDVLSSWGQAKCGSTAADKSSKFSARNIVDKSDAKLNIPRGENYKKRLNTSEIENPSSPVATGLAPYSNPLKQSSLNFIANQSRTPTTPEQPRKESPLLFKDPDDKTPVHFTEPPRRSYVRSVRKKMRPLGDEWVEFDSESEGEGERTHAAETKKKKGKLSKQEEKKANKWMQDFNRQCEEIEDFELCVEK